MMLLMWVHTHQRKRCLVSVVTPRSVLCHPRELGAGQNPAKYPKEIPQKKKKNKLVSSRYPKGPVFLRGGGRTQWQCYYRMSQGRWFSPRCRTCCLSIPPNQAERPNPWNLPKTGSFPCWRASFWLQGCSSVLPLPSTLGPCSCTPPAPLQLSSEAFWHL